MSQREAEKLRRELDGVAGRRGPCFPVDLKQRTAKWLTEQRASGATVAELAEALGLAQGTALRWSNQYKASGTRSLVQVEVVPEHAADGGYVVVSPSGFRIEGLSFAEAAALLKALG